MNDAAENLRWQRKTICGPRLWPPHLVLTLYLAPVWISSRPWPGNYLEGVIKKLRVLLVSFDSTAYAFQCKYFTHWRFDAKQINSFIDYDIVRITLTIISMEPQFRKTWKILEMLSRERQTASSVKFDRSKSGEKHGLWVSSGHRPSFHCVLPNKLCTWPIQFWPNNFTDRLSVATKNPTVWCRKFRKPAASVPSSSLQL